jgi:hypothetical protein
MKEPGRALGGFRRTWITALAVTGVLTMTLALTTGTGTAASSAKGAAAAAGDAGVGNALAETIKVDPKAGGLTIGATIGRALAGHQNEVAQAASQAIDLGVIGTTLAAQGCDGGDPTLPSSQQPQALQVDSRQAGAAGGQTQQEDGVQKFAQATTDPFAKAVTSTAPLGLAGVINIGPAVATTTSGVVDGVRVATAVTDIAGITLPGGIGITGLHWEVRYPSTGDQKPSGSFSIAALNVAGVALPVTDPTAAIEQLNTVLGLLGLRINPPTVHDSAGVLVVDPISISVIPNAGRDAISNSILSGIQPIRQAVFAALLEANCSLATEITVLDIALGSITGAGSFNILLGGVQASSGELPENAFCLGCDKPRAGGSALPSLPTLPTTRPLPFTTPTTKPVAKAKEQAKQTGKAQPAATKPKLDGSRGGALAGVGLAGLACLAIVAEADRRKMRRAQRQIPTFQD